MRYEQLTNGEYYHIYNRGVDRRPIFQSDFDLTRFSEGMRVFNTTRDAGEPISFKQRCREHYTFDEQLVRICAFILMPNHFHFLLQQVQDEGISQFMHRHITSHTQFINIREQRSGCLLESSFKAKRIDSQAYLEHITRYIHLNALDLIGMDWKTQGILDKQAALDFLVSYRWSSFYYYFHGMQKPILDSTLLHGLFSSVQDHIKFLFDYQPSQSLQEDQNNDFL